MLIKGIRSTAEHILAGGRPAVRLGNDIRHRESSACRSVL